MARPGSEAPVPPSPPRSFSKFDPYRETDDDPRAASSPEAARRAWLLKWGTVVSQGMFYMGLAILGYYAFVR